MSVAIKLSNISHPVFENLVVSHISSGISDTVSQLGTFKTDFQPHFFKENFSPSNCQISVVLNLKQGEQPLQVRIHFNSQPIVEILAVMLGEKVDPLSQDILDGVGEISNMIYGLIKTKASQSGFNFGLGRPEAHFTQSLPDLKLIHHQALILPFKINSNDCYFELVAFA